MREGTSRKMSLPSDSKSTMLPIGARCFPRLLLITSASIFGNVSSGRSTTKSETRPTVSLRPVPSRTAVRPIISERNPSWNVMGRALRVSPDGGHDQRGQCQNDDAAVYLRRTMMQICKLGRVHVGHRRQYRYDRKRLVGNQQQCDEDQRGADDVA